MIAQTTELVQYSRATELATKYAAATTEIRRLVIALGEQTAALKAAFASECGYSSDFDVGLELHRDNYKADEDGADKIMAEFKRAAWSILVEKLGIRKLMSPKKRDELDGQLHGRRRNGYHVRDAVEPLPEINAESIIQVMQGFIQSAPEYVEDSIREVYKWLIPKDWNGGHVTNKRDRVGRKVIKTYCVQLGYSRGFRVHHSHEPDLIALDSIMHTLDGKGVLSGHKGPLIAAIETAESGTGETEYFRFKAYKNGNIHLEFKRLDLLDLFNRVACDGHRIGAEAAR